MPACSSLPATFRQRVRVRLLLSRATATHTCISCSRATSTFRNENVSSSGSTEDPGVAASTGRSSNSVRSGSTRTKRSASSKERPGTSMPTCSSVSNRVASVSRRTTTEPRREQWISPQERDIPTQVVPETLAGALFDAGVDPSDPEQVTKNDDVHELDTAAQQVVNFLANFYRIFPEFATMDVGCLLAEGSPYHLITDHLPSQRPTSPARATRASTSLTSPTRSKKPPSSGPL